MSQKAKEGESKHIVVSVCCFAITLGGGFETEQGICRLSVVVRYKGCASVALPTTTAYSMISRVSNVEFC